MKSLLIIPLLIFLANCNSGGNERPAQDAVANTAVFKSSAESAQSEEFAFASDQAQPEVRTPQQIKTGGLTFETPSVGDTYKKVQQVLPQFKAYIEHETQSRSEQRITYDLTLRVPSASYEELYNSLSGMAGHLEHKYSNTQDVTEQYYDLESHIRNKKALEERYLDILKQAREVKDILEVERNLNQVRTEIEQLQGQFNSLSKQIGLSSIQLSFYEQLPYVYDSSPRKGFWARILSALTNGWQGFLSFLVGLISLWPFALIIIGVVVLFRSWRRQRRKKL